MLGWLCRRPGVVLIATLLLLLPLFSFFLFYPIHLEADIRRGFAHKNGRSKEEFKRFADHFDLSYEGMELWVILVSAKGGEGELTMSQDVLNEIIRLDKHLSNFTMTSSDGGIVDSTRFLSGPQINDLLKIYAQMYSMESILPNINLTFPMSNVFGHRLFIGSHFFGVNQNGTKQDVPVHTVQKVGLWYMSDAPTWKDKRDLENVEMDIFRLALNDSFSPLISFEMVGDQVVNKEMDRGIQETRYLFVTGIVLMILFMVVMLRHLTPFSTMCMTAGALASPALATVATFSILGWVGATLNPIMCITPFLVVAIGVDDGFLLLQTWRRLLHKRRRNSIEKEQDPEKQRASLTMRVLAAAAPSMAITSSTNTLAFGIGIFSPTAQMSSFCLCTAIAVSLDFVFEFLIFTPVMALFYEEREQEKKPTNGLSWRWYSMALLSPAGIITVLALLSTFYISAAIGVASLVPTFDPTKAFPSDSKLVDSVHAFELIRAEYAPLNVLSRAPRLENATELARYMEMIGRLERQPGCQPNMTQSQHIDYIKREKELAKTNGTTMSYVRLPAYIEESGIKGIKLVDYSQNGSDVTVNGVCSFLICKGDSSWNGRAFALSEKRKILDSYSEFNASIFDYDSTIYDLIITVREELLKSVSVTFICMVVASSLFIHSVLGASVATLSMLSITFCMLGTLSHWGCDLDPVTMVNCLIAVGFSVDFSAHICVHFHRSTGLVFPSKEARLAGILRVVGKPIAEAAFSTFICVLPLFALPIYIFNAFAKTVCLVAFFGAFHGLVVIPVVLSLIMPLGKASRTDESCRPLNGITVKHLIQDKQLTN